MKLIQAAVRTMSKVWRKNLGPILENFLYFRTNLLFNPYIVIDVHGYDVDHVNGIKDLTDQGIGVRQSFL